MMKTRCDWADVNDLMIRYHDTEWGVPLHDDQKLFEFLVLDAFQAGLSWSTILNKRNNFRRAFDDFDPARISGYGRRKIETLLKDTGIIRNRLKIEASITNARAFLDIQTQFSSFDKYIWQFVGHKPIVNKWRKMKDIPANTTESDAMGKDLKKRGFRFAGTTICYAFMQAAGMVNDHLVSCFRYRQVIKCRKRN